MAILAMRAAIAIPALLMVPAALAQEAAQAPSNDHVVIESETSEGAVTVNAAAGTNNQQVNQGVIAVGGNAVSSNSVTQIMTESGAGAGRSAHAGIADNAFANSSGWIAVNVASGADNQQANLATIAFGIEGLAVTDTMLSQARASNQPNGNPEEAALPERTVALGDGSFANSSGLVQVSLVGGERNSSANIFALTVPGGANK